MLRDSIDSCELRFFIQHFVPLAYEYQEKVRLSQESSLFAESKVYSVLVAQIWSLFPAFSRNPTDLVASFNSTVKYKAEKERFPKVLGNILTSAADMRAYVLSGLRLLIRKNLENEEERTELAKFAKNYLPILFNLYTSNEDGRVDKTSNV